MFRTVLGGLNEVQGAQIVPLIRRGTFMVLVVLWLFAALALAMATWLLVARSMAQTEATAMSLEQYARRNIELGDFVTSELVDFLAGRGGVEGLEKDTAVPPELYRLNQRLPEGSSTAVVMPDGRVAVSTSKLPRKPLNLSDRRWFKAHAREGERSYIGPAIESRVTRRIVYTYTKAYFAQDGRLVGLINLGIPSDTIIGLAPHVARMNVAIVQHEGPLVAANPITPNDLGKAFPLPAHPKHDEVTVLGEAFGGLSIATLRNLPDTKLYVLAALPLPMVLAPALWGLGFGFPVLVLFTIALLNISRIAQKKSEEVQQALADNRVLFQEVHHRVKNNLQVISSLLRMQTDRMPEEMRPLMEQTAARVRAIAMVHEQIYSTSTPSVVQLDIFLKTLLEQLETSMLGPGRAVLTSSLQPVRVELDQAVPVALMATEAITNAIQHGLDHGNGSIHVTLLQETGRNILQVLDSGKGPPPGARSGLGTRIMTALARQIDGEWELERAERGGTRFTLSWPLHAPPPAC